MARDQKRHIAAMMGPVVENNARLLKLLEDQNEMFRDALKVLETSKPSLAANVAAMQDDFAHLIENFGRCELVRSLLNHRT